MSDSAVVRLKKGREKSVLRRHPWVFSGAISAVEGSPEPGEVVRVEDAGGAFAAWGYYNRRSQIQVRVLGLDEGEPVDENWWRRRLQQAIERRRHMPGLGSSNMRRLVHAEADGLPGLIVDHYDGFVVLQSMTAGIERVKPFLCAVLNELCECRGIYERSDGDVRSVEGLSRAAGVLSGEAPPQRVEVHEENLKYLVDIVSGHKTGFYIDQRDNRRVLSRYAQDKTVLDLFSYTGGFAMHVLRGGARRVTLVESSADALALARENVELNGLDSGAIEFVEANAFNLVRTLRDAAKHFDMIVVDPPKFAQTRAQAPRAERAYKDINLLAMKLLVPGGILATFSCSGAVGADSLSRVLAWASLDAGRNLQILERLSQSCDHPVNPLFPESQYLAGMICRIS